MAHFHLTRIISEQQTHSIGRLLFTTSKTTRKTCICITVNRLYHYAKPKIIERVLIQRIFLATIPVRDEPSLHSRSRQTERARRRPRILLFSTECAHYPLTLKLSRNYINRISFGCDEPSVYFYLYVHTSVTCMVFHRDWG